MASLFARPASRLPSAFSSLSFRCKTCQYASPLLRRSFATPATEKEQPRLRLGSLAPNFKAQTTQGEIDFHQWIGDKWAILFSHPADFTPVCTTELGAFAKLKPEFDRRGVKLIGLSANDLTSHGKWIADINDISQTTLSFPIIADPNRHIAWTYDMVDAQDTTNVDQKGIAFTIRSVFVIDPAKKIRLTMMYPASAGRNTAEVLRVVDALQTGDAKGVTTPIDWVPGSDVIVPPTVKTEEARKKFGDVREIRPYLRFTNVELQTIETFSMDTELKPVVEADSTITFNDTVGPNSHKQSSISTNSMITVRLSDSTIMPPEDCAIEDSPVEDSPMEEFTTTTETIDPGDSILEEEVRLFQRSHRMSTISMPSIAEEGAVPHTPSIRSRSDSSGTLSSSAGSAHVDWEELDKSEETAPRDEGSDESTAFLLARLEQENNALATDPKAAVSRNTRGRTKSRPPSIQQIKKLINEPAMPSLRYSSLPEPPPMTELEFWAALVSNYPQTAQRLPTLTSNKIRNGIPPPLRGVVWMSIAGARERLLEDEYERLCNETSPYESLIGKDIGRSFPNVEMFKDPAGEGQRMLAKVLKAFSIYDQKIGYCQGLGFVVGPLLMHMADKEAFCVLVRLMEHYNLRSCFLPDLSGLHLRIYQFQHLLRRHLPSLTAHLESLQVEPLYVSQWFLSFFAVTCPLPMLLRIYDVILTEGASETLMRVALSLMRRNDAKIKACTEFEDAMHLLLSRELWDTYNCNADELVNDFVGLTGLVTRESLESLEQAFKGSQTNDPASKVISGGSIQASASGFLGRFWAGSSSTTKVTSLTPSLAPSRPSSFLRRTPSKQSMASTLNSITTVDSVATEAWTEATSMSRNPSADCTNIKSAQSAHSGTASVLGPSHQDKDLHSQIEDLLTALNDMQREQNILATELQTEREEREEDRAVVCRFLTQTRKTDQPQSHEMIGGQAVLHSEEDVSHSGSSTANSPPGDELLAELEERFKTSAKRSSIVQTKSELREDLKLWKDQYEIEATRSADLLRQLADQESENARVLEQFREVRSRMQESQKEKQQLEKAIEGMRSRRTSTAGSSSDVYTPIEGPESRSSAPGGLREFKLGRAGSTPSLAAPLPSFSKRSSSLGLQTVLATEDHKPLADEALLLELVNAKTAEAVTRQELEEVKGKLDSLRKMLGNTGSSISVSNQRPSPNEQVVPRDSPIDMATSCRPSMTRAQPDPLKIATPASSGGFFSGWGKRTTSHPIGESLKS
ncbi:MAG: hypothetical protein Q9186_002816 [Xanthomendoza sp. 1 TL-2023]